MRVRGMLIVGLVLCGCAGMPVDEGGAATWALVPDADIGPETTEFTAMVTERACASGQSSADRIIGPDIDVTGDAVIVTFRVRPLPGAQECPSNPPTSVSVRLTEPLGDRSLLDGGREPPREPPVCANPQACE